MPSGITVPAEGLRGGDLVLRFPQLADVDGLLPAFTDPESRDAGNLPAFDRDALAASLDQMPALAESGRLLEGNGWNADSPPLKDYLARHKAATGQEPDRWASSITYASLQVLQQAIEKVGKVDRAAVAKEIRSGTFDTIIGKVKLDLVIGIVKQRGGGGDSSV